MTPNGIAIRDIRNIHGMPLRRLADLAGIAPSTLCRIEQEERGASDEVITRLAEHLGVRIGSITHRETPRDQEK